LRIDPWGERGENRGIGSAGDFVIGQFVIGQFVIESKKKEIHVCERGGDCQSFV
jgi:hypothetical protein